MFTVQWKAKIQTILDFGPLWQVLILNVQISDIHMKSKLKFEPNRTFYSIESIQIIAVCFKSPKSFLKSGWRQVSILAESRFWTSRFRHSTVPKKWFTILRVAKSQLVTDRKNYFELKKNLFTVASNLMTGFGLILKYFFFFLIFLFTRSLFVIIFRFICTNGY